MLLKCGNVIQNFIFILMDMIPDSCLAFSLVDIEENFDAYVIKENHMETAGAVNQWRKVAVRQHSEFDPDWPDAKRSKHLEKVRIRKENIVFTLC